MYNCLLQAVIAEGDLADDRQGTAEAREGFVNLSDGLSRRAREAIDTDGPRCDHRSDPRHVSVRKVAIGRGRRRAKVRLIHTDKGMCRRMRRVFILRSTSTG